MEVDIHVVPQKNIVIRKLPSGRRRADETFLLLMMVTHLATFILGLLTPTIIAVVNLLIGE